LLAVPTLAAAEPPPDLVGFYSGTYLSDRPGSSPQSAQLEVEKQHHRRLKVSVFAVNLPEFQGHGHLLHDNVTLNMKTKATGRGAPHLILTTLLDGSTISGSYVTKRPGLPDDTGTFSVSR
jgi:hypothetical protein